MKYKNLVIIGTSHISAESKKLIKDSFLLEKPEIIAVELDRRRLISLSQKQKTSLSPRMIRYVGVTGYLFALIGNIVQRKLGKIVNMNPGAEMMEAVKLAKINKIQLALIDQDIIITLKKLSKRITWREKLRFITDIIKSLFSKQVIKIDLRKVPSEQLINKLLKIFSKRYPSLYYTLVTERNHHMAKKLFVLTREHPKKKFLVVVGAGHEKGLLQQLKRLEDANISYTL
jgi:pheromone shutdown-related protein TraB